MRSTSYDDQSDTGKLPQEDSDRLREFSLKFTKTKKGGSLWGNLLETPESILLVADEKKKVNGMLLWICITHIAIKLAKKTNHKDRH